MKYQRVRKHRHERNNGTKVRPKTVAVVLLMQLQTLAYKDARLVAEKACGIRTPQIGSTVSAHTKQASKLNRATSVGKLPKLNKQKYATNRGLPRVRRENSKPPVEADGYGLINRISRTLTTK